MAKAAGTKGINKMEAMRQTIQALGKDASAKEIQDHLKKDFNVEMSIEMVYTYKANAIKQLGGGRKKGKRGRKAGAVVKSNGSGGAITLEDIQAVKAVIDRVGAQKVQELARVLSK